VKEPAGGHAPVRRILRFGVFELEPCSGELRKHGNRIRVPDQSLQVLVSLLARPGEIVTREELRSVLWPDGTTVDFDTGLNAAVKKLRGALGDSGALPRYIETIPRRGYRLMVSVSCEEAGLSEPSAPVSRISATRWPWNRYGKFAALVILLVAGGAIAFPTIRRYRVGPARDPWGLPSKNAEANGYFSKAQLFTGAGLEDLGRARHMYERALQLDPRFGRARAEYGFTHLLMVVHGYSNSPEWFYKAEEEIHRGLRDDPGFSHGYAALAALYLHHGRKEHAPREAERALRLNPQDVDARHWLATYHWYSGDSSMARKLEMENLARLPRFFPARMILGELAREGGDWQTSIREHEQVLEYDPQNGFVLELLARAYMDAGHLDRARLTLARQRPDDRSSFRTRAVEALLLALEGRREHALRTMDAATVRYLEVNPLFTLTGVEFNAVMGRVPEAIDWLERAVRNGDHRASWFGRDPALQSIRKDERFRQILNSIATRRSNSG